MIAPHLRFGVVLVLLGALSRRLPPYAIELATRIEIFAIFAMSLAFTVRAYATGAA